MQIAPAWISMCLLMFIGRAWLSGQTWLESPSGASHGPSGLTEWTPMQLPCPCEAVITYGHWWHHPVLLSWRHWARTLSSVTTSWLALCCPATRWLALCCLAPSWLALCSPAASWLAPYWLATNWRSPCSPTGTWLTHHCPATSWLAHHCPAASWLTPSHPATSQLHHCCSATSWPSPSCSAIGWSSPSNYNCGHHLKRDRRGGDHSGGGCECSSSSHRHKGCSASRSLQAGSRIHPALLHDTSSPLGSPDILDPQLPVAATCKIQTVPEVISSSTTIPGPRIPSSASQQVRTVTPSDVSDPTSKDRVSILN